jgi:hypothetical protein
VVPCSDCCDRIDGAVPLQARDVVNAVRGVSFKSKSEKSPKQSVHEEKRSAPVAGMRCTANAELQQLQQQPCRSTRRFSSCDACCWCYQIKRQYQRGVEQIWSWMLVSMQQPQPESCRLSTHALKTNTYLLSSQLACASDSVCDKRCVAECLVHLPDGAHERRVADPVVPTALHRRENV